jgi:hypothetical protein
MRFITPPIMTSHKGIGATYYVSNAGSDAANGTSPSTSWQTISKVNGSTFNPGDIILFKKGDTWREQLNVPSSGSEGRPITFGAYGSGAKPIINAADIKTGWTNAGSNQWWIVNPNATTSTGLAIINGTLYSPVASLGALTSANHYFIDTSPNPDRMYVYSTVDPGTQTAEITARDYCIRASTTSTLRKYIAIENIEVRYAGRGGMYFEATGSAYNGYSTVTNCTAYANLLWGIVHIDRYDHLTVTSCTSTFNGNGFYSWVANYGSFISCTSSDNIAYTVPATTDGHAFGSYQGSGWLVESCRSDRDNDSIHIDAGSTPANAIIRYNQIYSSKTGSPNTPGGGVGSVTTGGLVEFYYNLYVNCASSAFECFSSNTGQIHFYNNTIFLADGYGTDQGTWYTTDGTGFVLKNNIISRMGADGKTLITVINSVAPTMDYNQYFQGPLSSYRWYLNGNFTTLANWRTATGGESHSATGDPLFVNQASDWSLQAGSPCINAGVDLGLTRDILGNPIVGNPDMGCYEHA